MDFNGQKWNLGDLKVMVVDDQVFIQEQISRLLAKIGVSQVETVGNPNDAYDKLKEFPADLIIVDWQMSPMTGKELIERINDSPDFQENRPDMFMLTASPTLDRVDEAMRLGVKSFLAKPVTAQKLHEKIINYVKAHRRDMVID